MKCTDYLCQFSHKKDASENVDNVSVNNLEDKAVSNQETNAGSKLNDNVDGSIDTKKALEIALLKINKLEENKLFLQNKLTQYTKQLKIFIKEREEKKTS